MKADVGAKSSSRKRPTKDSRTLRRPPSNAKKNASPGNGRKRPGSSSENGLVRQSLVEKMHALITDGTYRPGNHMTERELCERLKASRPSIRETLRQLEAEGLVDIYPNRGAIVRTLDKETVLQLWEIRQTLETLAAERFIRHGRTGQIDRLDRAIRRMDSALRSRNQKKIKTAMGEVLESFVAGANSDLLSDYVRQINVRLSFLWSSSLLVEGRPAESINEWRVLLGAIKQGNPEAAVAAVVLYNEHAKTIALHALENL